MALDCATDNLENASIEGVASWDVAVASEIKGKKFSLCICFGFDHLGNWVRARQQTSHADFFQRTQSVPYLIIGNVTVARHCQTTESPQSKWDLSHMYKNYEANKKGSTQIWNSEVGPNVLELIYKEEEEKCLARPERCRLRQIISPR